MSNMVHSDQGSQFTSYEWAAFLDAHNFQPGMIRRGNCHDDAIAESFSNCSNANALNVESLAPENWQARIFSTT
jgi:transposase InsO family protein|tara:strand:- start:6135 stop:6356 length:222 start_codon:yes stop_codon:yes gene_type:complete